MPPTDNPNAGSSSNFFPISSRPGIQRDGTEFDSETYVDGQWCRFQRGRPKKIGGYRMTGNQFDGPIRAMFAHVHAGHTHFICGSSSNLQVTDLLQSGIGSGVIDVTPTLASGFIPNSYNTWQFAELYDSVTQDNFLLAHAAPNLLSIDNDTDAKIWIGNDDLVTPWVVAGDAPEVSGGITSNAPYVLAYGNDGYYANCVPNNPNDWTGVGSNEARVTRSKIVYGAPVRGGAGQAPAFLLISLDAVLRATFAGGSAVFDFDTITASSSILSSASVVEYDGLFFWPGVDRFLMYNGIVQEVVNESNINYFYDNLNWNQRQKVWGTKVPRFNEIWWFYPRGNSEECNAAIIFNLKQNIWYDTSIERSAGYYPQVFRWPVWAATRPSTAKNSFIRVTSGTAATSNGGTAANAFDDDPLTTCTQVAINGNISYTLTEGANKTVSRVGIMSFTTQTYNLIFEYADDNLSTWSTLVDPGSQSYTASEAVFFDVPTPVTARAFRVRETGGNTLNLAEVYFEGHGYMLMQHEFGVDAVVDNVSLAIPSYVTTGPIDYVGKGPLADRWLGVNRQVLLKRIEPDLIQNGAMTVTVIGRRYPRDVTVEHTFTMAQTPTSAADVDGMKMDLTEQFRIMNLKFESNTLNGFYEMGEIMLRLQAGDASA